MFTYTRHLLKRCCTAVVTSNSSSVCLMYSVISLMWSSSGFYLNPVMSNVFFSSLLTTWNQTRDFLIALFLNMVALGTVVNFQQRNPSHKLRYSCNFFIQRVNLIVGTCSDGISPEICKCGIVHGVELRRGPLEVM